MCCNRFQPLLTVVDFCNVTFRNEAESEGRQNSPLCETNRIFQEKDYFQELYVKKYKVISVLN
jgi:hypothetical protein